MQCKRYTNLLNISASKNENTPHMERAGMQIEIHSFKSVYKKNKVTLISQT